MNLGSSIFSNYSPAEADWGIEESLPHQRFNSTTGSDYSQALRIIDRYPFEPSHNYREDTMAQEDVSPMIGATTENFHKYIVNYLSMKSLREIVLDKFKYNLVLSNLLDDSLVLSKNEQALTNLLLLRRQETHLLPISLSRLNPNCGLRLQITQRLYKLVMLPTLGSSSLLLNTLSLIIFLLKQNIKMSSKLPNSSRVRLFRVLILVATQIVNYRRTWTSIEASKSIRCLDDFIITNCKINKAIITSILSIKEFEMFSFLNRSDPTSRKTPLGYSEDLKNHLETILNSLILNVRYSIRELLPFSNGEILEKYCEVNSVPLGVLADLADLTEGLTLESLTQKLTKFNNLRRFFVCQLLTIHDPHLHNFFVLKLCDNFNVNIDNFPTFISTSQKLRILCQVFSDNAAALTQLLAHNLQYKALHSFNQAVDYVNDDVLAAKNQKPTDKFSEEFSFSDLDLALGQLVDKLQNLTTSLQYFKKYKQSVASDNNAVEHEQKLSIFDLFGKELSGMINLYQTCMTDLNHEFNAKLMGSSCRSSCSTSNRNSANNDQFNLKAFHTSARSSKKQVTLSGAGELVLANGQDRKLRKLSVGLQLGLLTVLEEPLKKPADFSPKSDEETLSRMKPAVLQDCFNAKAFEALTKKQDFKNSNRYSMYSLNSNISGLSDLIASTNITADAESPDMSKGQDLVSPMSKAQLKEKLEESYSRIFAFDAEQRDKPMPPLVYDPQEPMKENGFSPGVPRDAAFLMNLEEMLNMKTSTS